MIRQTLTGIKNIGGGGGGAIAPPAPMVPTPMPHNMVGLQRMLDYRGVGLQRFH